jgi:hypothetical protein
MPDFVEIELFGITVRLSTRAAGRYQESAEVRTLFQAAIRTLLEEPERALLFEGVPSSAAAGQALYLFGHLLMQIHRTGDRIEVSLLHRVADWSELQ